MADDFGTPIFQDRWRKGGFFDAANKISQPAGKANSAEVTNLNARLVKDHIDSLRKALQKLSAAVNRVEMDIQPGLSGGRVDAMQIDRDIEAAGGWLATAVGAYSALEFFTSEMAFNKIEGFFRAQEQDGSGMHPSRLAT